MAPDLEDRVPREILEALIQEGTEAFRKVLEKLLNLAMGLERSEFLAIGCHILSMLSCYVEFTFW